MVSRGHQEGQRSQDVGSTKPRDFLSNGWLGGGQGAGGSVRGGSRELILVHKVVQFSGPFLTTPKTSKMTPKTSKMIPKTTQMTPKMGQDGLQEVVLDSLGPLKRKKTMVCVGFCIGSFSELCVSLGLCWGSLRALLGLSRAVLGLSWGCLGPSWGSLGAVLGLSWAIFGLSWSLLGFLWALLGPLGVALGSLGPLLGSLGKAIRKALLFEDPKVRG